MQSMTGCGSGTAGRGGWEVTVDLKAVNHRFLDVSLRLPRNLLFLDQMIRERLSAGIRRGHVDVYLNVRIHLERFPFLVEALDSHHPAEDADLRPRDAYTVLRRVGDGCKQLRLEIVIHFRFNELRLNQCRRGPEHCGIGLVVDGQHPERGFG